jgi:hypothetical protein
MGAVVRARRPARRAGVERRRAEDMTATRLRNGKSDLQQSVRRWAGFLMAMLGRGEELGEAGEVRLNAWEWSDLWDTREGHKLHERKKSVTRVRKHTN